MRSLSFTICRRSFLVSSAVAIFGRRVVSQAAAAEDDDAVGDVFPLLACPVCETKLGGTDVIVREEDREFRVCDQQCLEDFQADFFSFVDAIDDQIKVEQREVYPLKTCLVDGQPLEGKEPIDVVFRNRLFRVCCDDCWYKIQDEPAKYFAKLNEAVVKAQKPTYPIETCIVSKKPLGNKAVDHICANMLVRLADEDQIKRFNESPGKYLEVLRELRKKGKQ